MKGYTIQHSIDLLEKNGGGGGGSGTAPTAADVSYDNSDSGLTAETVQAAIDELADAPDPDADDISYDNTDSGLTADTVQGAIDEIVGIIPDLFPQDNLEHQIGSVFVRHFSGASISGTGETLISALAGKLIAAFGTVSSEAYKYPLNYRVDANSSSELTQTISSGDIRLEAGSSFRGPYDVYVVYSKNS